MVEFSVETFESSGRDDGIRYWYAHEFMHTLGYATWPAFQSVVTKAMGSCAKLNIDPTEVFVPTTVEDQGRELRTYKLTRFACFLVSMHADSKKPEVAKAKAVLAAIADQLIQSHIHDHDFGRLEVRDDLKLAEKVMSGIAVNAGLDGPQLAIFKDAGFRGMYNMSLQHLKLVRGVGEGKTLYDFMGLEELAGNLFRVTQTAARIKSQRVASPTHAINTAKDVGKEVREMMIRNSGTAPEQLPKAEDIGDVKKRLKSAHRKMKRLDKSVAEKRLPSKI